MGKKKSIPKVMCNYLQLDRNEGRRFTMNERRMPTAQPRQSWESLVSMKAVVLRHLYVKESQLDLFWG